MSASRATIVDVAEAAGVAVGTASNALSGKGRVSAATRARVAKVAEELAYVPNRGASGLPRGRTMTIGIRFGHEATIPSGDFFVELLDAAAAAADKGGYGLLIRRSGRPQLDPVDAQIVVDPTDSDALDETARAVPLVTIGRNRARSVPSVDVDHETAMGKLLEHLQRAAEAGPAWFLALPQHLGFVDALEDAFSAWVATRGREAVVLRSPDDAQRAFELVQEQLRGSPAPALVATALDRQAVGVHHALRASGQAVPPIGSASDGDALALMTPPISGMALDGAAHGRTAVQMILDWLRTGDRPQSVVLPARLRAR